MRDQHIINAFKIRDERIDMLLGEVSQLKLDLYSLESIIRDIPLIGSLILLVWNNKRFSIGKKIKEQKL